MMIDPSADRTSAFLPTVRRRAPYPTTRFTPLFTCAIIKNIVSVQPNGLPMDLYSEGGVMMAEKRYAGLSFEDAVQKYAKSVMTACTVRLHNRPDADDCFQNTFFKLYHHAPDFADENHLKAWLLRVAINECKKVLRDNRRLIPLDSVRGISDAPADDRYDISWALMRLEEKYRDVLYLYYIERYKVDEIADILGSKPNTVKSLLMRGRARLKEIYGGDDDA